MIRVKGKLRTITLMCASTYAGLSAHTVFAEDTLPAVAVTAQKQRGDDYAPTNATSALKIDAQQRDIPQTVNVITDQVIRDQAAHSLQDVMKNVPGVGLATGDGQRDAFVIRGFTALYDVYQDGLRDDAQYFRDLYNIDRIEVIKGPAAVLYGRGSSGGLVNLITKKPTFTRSGEISTTFGSYGEQRNEISLNQPLNDRIAFHLDGAYEDSNTYRSQGYVHNRDISPSMLYKDNDQSLLLQYDYQHQRRSIDFGVPGYLGGIANVDPSQYYGAQHVYPNDYSESTVEKYTAKYQRRLSANTQLSQTFRYYEYSLDRNHTRINSANDLLPVPTVTLGRGNIIREEHGWFDQLELTHDLKLGGTRHQFLVGTEFGQQNKYALINNSTRAPYIYTTSLFNPVGQDLPFTVGTAPQSQGLARMTTAAGYVQDLSTWTPQIKTLIGFRYDHFGQRYDDQLPANNDLKRNDNKLSTRYGIVWQPADWQSYYVSYSNSFQPSAEGVALAANNAQLAPEKTRNIEIGTKLDVLGGNGSINAALYQLTRTDVKVTDPLNSNNLIPVGEQRSRGFEVSFTGQVLPTLQVIAGYSYMDALVTEAVGTVTSPLRSASAASPLQGKTLALAPKHTASLWLLESLGRYVPGLQAGGGVTYRGSNYAAIDNGVKVPSFVTVDLALYYQVPVKGLSLQFNVKNLFDRKYYISAGNDVGIMPGEPRSFEVTARYAF